MKRRVYFEAYEVALEAEVKQIGQVLLVMTEPRQITDFGNDKPQQGDIIVLRPEQKENEYNHWDREKGIFVLNEGFWSEN